MTFGNFLGQIIAADFDGHRANFARACGLTPSAMTLYLLKGELPTPQTLSKIAKAVEDIQKRAELIATYHADIHEQANVEGVEVSARQIHSETSAEKECRQILTKIERRCRHDAAFRRIVHDIAAWP